ncbi:MAG: cytochrome b/b6 domain-containing protein [Bacteroidota bacterium]|nr:cytochrome b/b6 domain-containing protein [Bacteroidota bacterium]
MDEKPQFIQQEAYFPRMIIDLYGRKGADRYFCSNFNLYFLIVKKYLMDRVTFSEAHSRAIRLWHWASVFVMSFILLTAFTGKFFFNNIHIAGVLDQQLQKQGAHLSQEQIWDTTFVLRDAVWKWHSLFGYILSGLFVFRIASEFFQPRNQQFSRRIKNAVGFLKLKQDKKTARHYLAVKIIYLLAYILIALLAGTGIWMAVNRNTKIYFTPQFHSVKEIHAAAVNFLLLFMIIHIAGVIKAERGKYKNIVSGMIHGEK